MAKITTSIARERFRGPLSAIPARRGEGKCWAKHVTRIDPSKTNGYAFIGDWVRFDQSVELPVDAVVLAFEGTNSKTEFSATIRVLQATERGVAEIERLDTSDRGWALMVRPIIESLLGPVETFYRVILSEDQYQVLIATLEGETLDGLMRDPEAALATATVAVANAEVVR